MGNNLEKVFHDDEYEVTLRIRRRDRGGAGNAATAAEAVAAAAVNGDGDEETPAANGSRVRKSVEDGSLRARKVFKPGAFVEDSSDSEQQAALPLEEATPRSARYAGRKTSCMKWSDSGLDMTVLKSHLSPNFHVTVPPEFVDLHGSSFEITNGQRCNSLEIDVINRTRFKFKKQHWAAIVHEHHLQLNDTVYFRLESKGKLRVEKGLPVVQFTPAEPSASPPPFPAAGGAAELCSPGATDSTGAATSGAAPAAGVVASTAAAAAAAPTAAVPTRAATVAEEQQSV